MQSHPYATIPPPPTMLAPALLAAAAAAAAAGNADLMSSQQRAWLATAARGGSGDAAAAAAAASWPAMTAAQARQLFAAEEALDATYHRYHQAWGQYANPHYPSKTDRSKVLKWDELGDSSAWSGHYLASLAFRYNATRDLRTLRRIEASLQAFENKTAISGKPGFMVRFMGIAADPAYQAYYCQDERTCARRSGNAWFHGAKGGEFGDWVYLDSLSRDACAPLHCPRPAPPPPSRR